MKKAILGIVLFIQFSHGMEEVPDIPTTSTTAMVSSRFLEESEARFRTNLESVLKSVTEGSITPETAIVSLRGDHRKSLELLSSCLNQKYLEQMEKQGVAQEELIHRITAEKEHEIQVLGSELDTLRSLAATSENLRVFDQELEAARIKVIKAIQAALSPVKTLPLVPPHQVDWTSERFNKQLDEIKKEVRNSKKFGRSF